MSALPASAAEAATARRLTLGLLVFYLVYLFSTPYQALYFDSMTYWDLTGRFYYATKSFNLLSFDSSIRGYLLPLLLFPFRVVAYLAHIPPIQFTRAIGAVVAALLFGWAAPAAWQAVVSAERLSWRRRLAFAALGFVFWRDYFVFPLTDFYSLLLMLLVFWLVLRRGGHRGWLLLAGVLCMAAANLRPVYAGAAGLLLLGGVWLARRQHGLSWRLIGRQLAVFLLGMALVGGPQLAINVRHFGRYTPFVLTWKNPSAPQSLYLSQLSWGLAVQKYETTIDPTYRVPGTTEPEYRIMYVDEVGQRIMDEEQISFIYGLRDLSHYLTAVRHNPVDMLALYGRHVFNGLDVKYATPYLPRVFGSTLPLSLLNYTVLFLAGLVLLLRRHRRLSWPQWIALLVLVGPCLLAIPTAMECRFFIPIYLLLYAVLCFCWPPNWRAAFLRWPVALAYAGFVLLCLMLSSNTLWHMTNGPRLLWP
ncbi:hypothetical protein EJV47_04370 [Hymenobacter gummosus]|uniref:Glycosyltransferase RgtA/B/C/D-like domain-containing protein n=1 Tax=Hymenobacter gummosus TaxID=1776032 RepID=A0A3S0JCK3_9BACT|nr:hypothetical protein [Hymenobacter gummosus]RTQ52266.1 hypothetical protein EJV47_04370 [Hymenobacter gummosus]